jgi:hypothetical protein
VEGVALVWRLQPLKPSVLCAGIAEKKHIKRRFVATIPLKSLNKTNEIVERNQWNRSTKSMVLFRKSASLAMPDCRFLTSVLAVLSFGSFVFRGG